MRIETKCDLLEEFALALICWLSSGFLKEKKKHRTPKTADSLSNQGGTQTKEAAPLRETFQNKGQHKLQEWLRIPILIVDFLQYIIHNYV